MFAKWLQNAARTSNAVHRAKIRPYYGDFEFCDRVAAGELASLTTAGLPKIGLAVLWSVGGLATGIDRIATKLARKKYPNKLSMQY